MIEIVVKHSQDKSFFPREDVIEQPLGKLDPSIAYAENPQWELSDYSDMDMGFDDNFNDL